MAVKKKNMDGWVTKDEILLDKLVSDLIKAHSLIYKEGDYGESRTPTPTEISMRLLEMGYRKFDWLLCAFVCGLKNKIAALEVAENESLQEVLIPLIEKYEVDFIKREKDLLLPRHEEENK